MKILKHRLGCVVLAVTFASCGSKNEAFSEAKQVEKKDSTYSIEPDHLAVKTFSQLTEAKGNIGIFDVPEMLTVAKLDSAKMTMVAAVLAKNYRIVQNDIKLMKAEVDGAAGAIYYNNDTANFKFECIVPIKEMPTIKPKNSQVVVLEATHMLVYNYYGSYENLYLVYDEIREYIKIHKIEQTGPLREFYITDPDKVKDPNQWLTRIMVPVK